MPTRAHSEPTNTSTRVLDWLRLEWADKMGRPTRVCETLNTITPPTLEDIQSPANIDASHIPDWYRFAEQATLPGFAPSRSGQHECCDIDIPELGRLVNRKVCERTIDVRDVGALSASKSNLRQYYSLSDLALNATGKLADQLTRVDDSTLADLMAHNEIRITRDPAKSPDYFEYADWDGRIQLCNHGGSHHFAAAHWMAKELAHPYPVTARYVEYTVDPVAMAHLNTRFAIHFLPEYHFSTWLDAMQKFDAAWYWRDAPPPLGEYQLIFLPLNSARSHSVAWAMAEAGFPSLTDALTPETNIRKRAKTNF